MDPAVAGVPASAPIAFEDGLGERHHTVSAANEPLEILTLREELTAVSSFEFALRERVSRLASFHSPSYVRVRGVERVEKGASTLAIVSDHVPGVRLSDILAIAEKRRRRLELNAALCLIRQLVAAVATLHEEMPDVCHGAIAAERIVIPPNGRLVIVEHVLGAALEQLRYSVERYWKELRIPLPRTVGLPRFDKRADVTEVGALALALILGRPLRDNEYPTLIGDMASGAWAVSATGGLEPLPAAVRAWLLRALQLDARGSFGSAVEARAELDAVLGDRDYSAEREALDLFLTQSAKVQASSLPKVPAPTPAAPVSTASQSSTQARLEPAVAARTETVFEPPRLAPEKAEVAMSSRKGSSHRRLVAAAAALVALASGGTLAAWYLMASSAAAAMGTLVVNTNPAGVAVAIDGKQRGTTPLNVALPPGAHVLELLTGSDRRTIPITITAGGQVSQFIEMPKTVAALGQLHVRTEPSGAKVTVDGHLFGKSPVTVSGLTPGPHSVVLEGELGSVTQEVTIEAGTTASLVVPLTVPRGAPVSGWISVNAPADVQVFENGRLLGSSKSERIMVSAGEHQLELVNEALGYRASRTVQVSPGQVAAVRPSWPKGSVALNAIPWADVFIDGERIGETPIGHVSVPIGTHEVLFRHPDLGEKRSTVTVTLEAPAKLSVDLRKK